MSRLALLFAAALLAPGAGCASDDVTGMTFSATERLTGEGPLGTCAFDLASEPLSQADAQALPWSAGSTLGLAGAFTRSCGGLAGDPCEPVTDFEYFLLGKPRFTFEPVAADRLSGLGGEVTGLLSATGAGSGGLGVRRGDDTYGPLALEARAPGLLKLTTFTSWDGGKAGPRETGVPTAVQAGSTLHALVRVYDASGVRLCGRGPLGSTATGLAVAGNAGFGAADPRVNSALALTFGAAGTAALTLSFGEARLALQFDVRP